MSTTGRTEGAAEEGALFPVPGRIRILPLAPETPSESLLDALAAYPGAAGVTASLVPLLSGSNWGRSVRVEGFEAGYSFVGWTGDVPSGQEQSNPLSLTMNGNKSVMATFTLINDLTLSVSSGDNGSVVASPARSQYDFFSTVQVTENGRAS